MNLSIAGTKESPTVAFRLEQDGNDVNVYAGSIFVGWFQVTEDNKIEFKTAYLSESEGEIVARDEEGKLKVS